MRVLLCPRPAPAALPGLPSLGASSHPLSVDAESAAEQFMGYCHAQMVEQNGQLAVEFNAGLGYIPLGLSKVKYAGPPGFCR